MFLFDRSIFVRPCFLFVLCVNLHLSSLAWLSPSPVFLAHCNNMRNMSDSNSKLFSICPHGRLSSHVLFPPVLPAPFLTSYATPAENRQTSPMTEQETAATTTTANAGLPHTCVRISFYLCRALCFNLVFFSLSFCSPSPPFVLLRYRPLVI